MVWGVDEAIASVGRSVVEEMPDLRERAATWAQVAFEVAPMNELFAMLTLAIWLVAGCAGVAVLVTFLALHRVFGRRERRRWQSAEEWRQHEVTRDKEQEIERRIMRRMLLPKVGR